ncbi:uncharacterized protein [Argopecten irradians]|uniref:uncharacterized protein n=1 Tax=Argopecten irradians TaxID=31199 RepID=UPI003715EE72
MSKRHKELTSEVTTYITKCIMYAIVTNKANTELMRKALLKIVPHIFGDHHLCQEDAEWCKYKDNPSTFKYKSLPRGEKLKSQELRSALEELLQKYADRSEHLTELGSTQQNENFNQIVATKAPKSRHYGGSTSLMNRVAASVLQKNEGHSYLKKINKAATLSPGFYTNKLTTRLDRIREERKKKQRSIYFKRKRIQLKKKRKSTDRKLSLHESISYQTDLEMMSNTEEHQEIPVPAKLSTCSEESFIIFDIETTGLARTSDITQLAAVCGDKEYQSYVMPRSPISTEASKVTGLTCSLAENKLYKNGKEVKSVTLQTALLDFLDFLESFTTPILVGHNAASFDINILTNKLREFNLFSRFCTCVSSFIDTLKVARRIYPKKEVGNYKQCTLVKAVINKEYQAHSAIEDVRALQELFHVMSGKIQNQDLISTKYCICKASYDKLTKSKSVSQDVVNKLSRGGISLSHFRLAKSRDPKGVQLILQENRLSSKWVSAFTTAFEHES